MRSAARLLLLVLPLTGCADAAAIFGSARDGVVEGLRTDADGRALVATYTGGACDGPDRLVVRESFDRVEIAVRIEVDAGGDGACPAVGIIGRSVRAKLDEPLGDRTVLADGVVLVPYDGADLVAPSRLPDGLVLRSEGGRSDDGWTQTYGPEEGPQEASRGGSYRPQERSLEISTGPDVFDSIGERSLTRDGAATVQGQAVHLYVEDGGTARYAALRVDGRPVAVTYGADCGGPVPSRAELVEIAESLRPARP